MGDPLAEAGWGDTATAARAVLGVSVGRLQGNRFVAIASPPVSFETLGDDSHGRYERARVAGKLIGSNVALQVRARRRGVRTKYVLGSSLKNNEVADAVYRDFLPAALASGRYRAEPRPTVVGHGLADL